MKKVLFGCLAIGTLAAFTLKPSSNNDDIVVVKVKANSVSASLLGANETPSPTDPNGEGDPDGAGFVELILNQGQGTITYTLSVAFIDPATAAHIHEAPAGTAGPVVVPLIPPTSGMSSGTIVVGKELVKEIRQNPEDYYVNVHNTAYPSGAVRGQLSK